MAQTQQKVFSFDAETNGLWGKSFAIAAVVAKDGQEVDRFVGRCPIEEEVNPWVAENVLPQMEAIPVTHESYEALLKDFVAFWLAHKDGAATLVHMGQVVEAKLFRDAHNLGFIGDWDAPYLWYDLCVLPEVGDSVDNYIKTHGIELPTLNGGSHNPLYDSYAALAVYEHIFQKN